MAITNSGHRVLAKMQKQYGPTKAHKVFASMIGDGAKGTEKWQDNAWSRRKMVPKVAEKKVNKRRGIKTDHFGGHSADAKDVR